MKRSPRQRGLPWLRACPAPTKWATAQDSGPATLPPARPLRSKIVDGMTKKGYEKMVRSMPGLLQGAFDMSVAGQCFANNLAFSAGQSWELKFEHFLSA